MTKLIQNVVEAALGLGRVVLTLVSGLVVMGLITPATPSAMGQSVTAPRTAELASDLASARGDHWKAVCASFNAQDEFIRESVLLVLERSDDFNARLTGKILRARREMPEVADRIDEAIVDASTNMKMNRAMKTVPGSELVNTLAECSGESLVLAGEIALKRNDLHPELRLQAVRRLDNKELSASILKELNRQRPGEFGPTVIRKLRDVYRNRSDPEIISILENTYNNPRANSDTWRHRREDILNVLSSLGSSEALDLAIRLRDHDRTEFERMERTPWNDEPAVEIYRKLIPERSRLQNMELLFDRAGSNAVSEEEILAQRREVNVLQQRHQDRYHWETLERCVRKLVDRTGVPID